MLKFFRIPFATSGDRTAIPDPIDPSGFVSYTEGYGFDYQRQETDPAAKNIERDRMNELFFSLTTAVGELQSAGIPDFISTALNGGTAYSYGLGALVNYSGATYVSRKAANTSLPSVAADWSKVRLAMPRVAAGGTADVITANFVPDLGTLQDGDMFMVRHTAANATTTPTINPDGAGALSIYKNANAALAVGDIPGAGFWGLYAWDATLSKLQMLNPVKNGQVPPSSYSAPTRAVATNYTNTSDQPLTVIISITVNGGNTQTTGTPTVDGFTLPSVGIFGGTGISDVSLPITFVVPPGKVYRFDLSNGGVQRWVEL